MPETSTAIDLEPVTSLTRDLKRAARTLSSAEARYLVDAYYQMQEDRIRADAQIRSQLSTGEPHEVLGWLGTQTARLEQQIKRALDAYSDSVSEGRWAKSIIGIGPVIAAGLLAHIDMEPWVCAVRDESTRCTEAQPHGPGCHRQRLATVGHLWRFAGLDPTVTWEKRTRRPWNARLKTLCWKIGESFVKQSGREGDVYGQLYLARKAAEQQRNEAGAYAEAARLALERKRYRDDTKAKRIYLEGRLPPAHLHARAKRYAVKLFLSHYHAAAYVARFGELPPKPYILTVEGGHAHEIEAPNRHLIDGWV